MSSESPSFVLSLKGALCDLQPDTQNACAENSGGLVAGTHLLPLCFSLGCDPREAWDQTACQGGLFLLHPTISNAAHIPVPPKPSMAQPGPKPRWFCWPLPTPGYLWPHVSLSGPLLSQSLPLEQQGWSKASTLKRLGRWVLWNIRLNCCCSGCLLALTTSEPMVQVPAPVFPTQLPADESACLDSF